MFVLFIASLQLWCFIYIFTKKDIMAYDILRKRIKEKRKALGYTQNDLAELSGLSGNSIGRIELGQAEPSLKTIMKILDVLGLELFVQVKEK